MAGASAGCECLAEGATDPSPPLAGHGQAGAAAAEDPDPEPLPNSSDVELLPGAPEGFRIFFHTFGRSPARRQREGVASGDILFEFEN